MICIAATLIMSKKYFAGNIAILCAEDYSNSSAYAGCGFTYVVALISPNLPKDYLSSQNFSNCPNLCSKRFVACMCLDEGFGISIGFDGGVTGPYS